MIQRVLASIAVAVVGLLIGLVGGFVQADRQVAHGPWGAVPVPWGAALVVVVLLVAIRGALWAVRRRSAGWLVFAGWLVGSFVAATASPSGDIAIGCAPGDSCVRQWGYLLVAVVLGAAAAAFPILGQSSLTIDQSEASDDPPSP